VLTRPALSAVVAATRRSRGLQQSRLAADLGLSPAALSHMETTRSTISERFLTLFAERLFGANRANQFIQLISDSDDEDVDDLAEFVCPNEPDRFMEYYWTSLGKLGGVSARSPRQVMASFAPVFAASIEDDNPMSRIGRAEVLSRESSQSARLQAFRAPLQAKPGLRRSAHDDAVEALRKRLQDHGLHPEVASRNTLQTPEDVRIRVDLLDYRARIAVDVRDPGQYGFRFLAEMIAKSVLLRDQGYRFVLYFTAEPTSQLDRSLSSSIAKYGGRVTWSDDIDSAIRALSGR